MLIDTHAHLDFPDFADELDAVLARAAAAGVTRVITIGTTVEGSRRAIAIAEKFPQVFATVGIHPSNADEAGADCLYAPGIRTDDAIAAVVAAVAPKPVNLLVHGDFITVTGAARLGVRRISVGGALAAAREIADHGTFSALSAGVPSAELNSRFPARGAAREDPS